MSIAIQKKPSEYEQKPRLFLETEPSPLPDSTRKWIETAVGGLTENARIFEIGSGDGQNADYVESLGYDVECAEFEQPLVSQLLEKGFNAKLHNAILDPIIGSYDLIFAHQSLSHYAREEVILVTSKVLTALKKRGRFAFSLKRKAEDKWPGNIVDSAMIGKYWSLKEIDMLLRNTGFTNWVINRAAAEPGESEECLYVTAYK